MLILTPLDILIRGFLYVPGLPNLPINVQPRKTHMTRFKRHYGSSPVVVAFMWYDLQLHGIVSERERTERGLRRVLTALHFLWSYPKNRDILATEMGWGCTKMVEGENLWKWIRIIARLKPYKIVWPEDEYNDPDSQIFIVSVDGVDFKCWEKKHPTLPYDKGQYSHKFNHGALKYEIAIDVYRNKVVWINGPFRGGEHDKNIYSGGLRSRIPRGKKIIADRVYGSRSQPDDHEKLSLPNGCDPPELKNFKARVRARHEGFNGRLKHFASMSDTFHHQNEKHKFVFEAVCVTCQYQMDHGSPLFDA